jgi:glycosyltransferase involved in cell wall biosynthesis
LTEKFVKLKSESKGANLRIANILISGVWGEVSPEALERGIGGREGAMIYLSREWAKQGHEVTNFVNVEQGSRFEEYKPLSIHGPGRVSHDVLPTFKPQPVGFHEYVPLNLTRPMLANFPWDVAIAWECPSTFEDHRILNNIKLKICEMQVCHFSLPEKEAAENYCDYIAALSPWHREFLIHQSLDFDEKDVVVFPNGVDISRYPEPDYGYLSGKSPQFVYSSSPDRGLWHILEIWPRLRKDFPGASLLVGYGAQSWIDYNKWSHGRQGEMAVEIERLLKMPGVKDVGKIGQGELAELQEGADAWLYPLDAMNATESGCITAVENAAAGNPIITTDCDCMPTEFGGIGRIVDLPWDADKYYEAVYDVLTDEDYYVTMQQKGRKFAEGRDWSIIANQWLDLFKQHV